ncbi:MAG: VWA domain-containing protein [Planctomycetota bacterium]
MKEKSPIEIQPVYFQWRPLFLSVVIHFALFSVVFLVLFVNPKKTDLESPRVGQIVLAVSKSGSDVTFVDDTNKNRRLEPENNLKKISDWIGESPPSALGAQDKLRDPNLPGSSQIQVDSATNLAQQKTQRFPNVSVGLSKELLEMIAEDQQRVAARQPQGKATTIQLFGSAPMHGRRFVFLIDRSNSMGDQGLGVLKEARKELESTVAQLESNHRFQVVVYNNRTATIGRRELLQANDETRGQLKQFMRELMAFAGTNHENGLYAALAFKPDVIVMMTDGGSPELNNGQIKQIAQAAKETQIHTMWFGAGRQQSNNHFLKRLAESTAGTFRYIDVRAWRKRNHEFN